MTNRDRALAVLHYRGCDRIPVVDFGFNPYLLERWRAEGHLDDEDMAVRGDGGAGQRRIERKLGFDFNWQGCLVPIPDTGLCPPLPETVIEEYGDGKRKVTDGNGAIHVVKDGVGCIPSDAGTLLTGREAWEELYLPRLRYREERVRGLREAASTDDADPRGVHCGSLYGQIRNWMGVQALAYLSADDEGLLDEMLETVAALCATVTEKALQSGLRFDFGHFWEDICYKNGPLVNPAVFRRKVGPHYRRIVELLARSGIDLISLDCDGMIDHLLPVWLDCGVNVMFPVEVGTWNASLEPWRRKYGAGVLAVGGVDKRVFARDRKAVDREIERLEPLVALGGYLPCPDHRIPLDARWDNVQYYGRKFREVFG